MEPALIYWLISTVLIVKGYDLAAFIPIILCIDNGLVREYWLVAAIKPFIEVVITRDFWVLTISTLLILLGHSTSGLWLLFFCTFLPSGPLARLDQYWVMAGVCSTTRGLCGQVFVAAAAVTLLIQGWTWAAGALVSYGVLRWPVAPGWEVVEDQSQLFILGWEFEIGRQTSLVAFRREEEERV